MIKSKTIEILKSLSVKELKEFEKLISSPFFSTGRNVVPYYKELKKFYPQFDDEKLNEKYLFTRLYPGKNFSRDIIKKLNSELLKLCYEFLKQLAIKSNRIKVNVLTSATALEKGLDFAAAGLLEEAEKLTTVMPLNNSYYDNMPLINYARSNYYYNKRNEKNLNNILKNRLDTIDLITKNFFYNQFLYYPFLLLDRNWYEGIQNNIFLNMIGSFDHKNFLKLFTAKKGDPTDVMLLINLYCIISLKEKQETEYFNKLIKLFFDNLKLFDSELRYVILNSLFIIVKYKFSISDQDMYKKSRFSIIKFALKNEMHIDPILKYFPRNFFLEYFNFAVSSGEISWAEGYCKKYLSQVRKEDRKSLEDYCSIILLFEYNEYEKCLNELNEFDHPNYSSTDYFYYYKAAVYFELNLFDECILTLDSYSKYLNTGKHSKVIKKEVHTNFINAMRSLIRYSEKKDEKYFFQFENLLKEIDTKVVMHRWLNSKLGK
ncbi:MAG: hypothetical protein IPM96_09840 [Ignavibacteria bacterium]|nr:hypothetical protein [Ignavibacteria bacterium]